VGPLSGVKIVELAGIGPGPFAGMLLSDMGADIVRVDRAQQVTGDFSKPNLEPLYRGRRSVGVDLKNPDGVETVLRLVEQADALIEGFRPGVTERLGLGPDACLARNPRLVYGRMTGWGQDGPMAQAAGHDINYIALAGALAHFGREGQKPTPPINLIGDFGGGGMFLAFGIVCGVLEARGSGKGQVVDAAMVDGAAIMMTPFYGGRASGGWGPRGTNFIDTGAPFYDTYETSDGKYVALGAIEPQFYATLLDALGVAGEPVLADPLDQSRWPAQKARFTELFRSKTRDEWCALLEGIDACFAPVLDPVEAPAHPHNRARESFLDLRGVLQPAPAPRFSRTPAPEPRPPEHPGDATADALDGWGIARDEVETLRDAGALI
jgi:alpha-methylacyl-CoA racemase